MEKELIIKPNDVRIGNYVLYEGEKYKIYGMSEALPCLDTIAFGIGVVEWKDLEPIPLNEQWLIDFGFKKKEKSIYGNKYTYEMADWGFTIENSFEINKWFFGHEFYDSNNEGENNISMHFCHNLKFVHTLQNIMHSLTGQELIYNPINK